MRPDLLKYSHESAPARWLPPGAWPTTTQGAMVDVADAIPSLPDRFWFWVDKNGPLPRGIPERGPCWLWCGALDKRTGYGERTQIGKERDFPHHWAYRAMVGPIPTEPVRLEIDHECHSTDPECDLGVADHHRRCVNPDHLRLVTRAENMAGSHQAQKSHCVNGHPFEGDNLFVDAKGRRKCRTCNRETQRGFHAKRKAAGVLPPPDARCKYGHPYSVDSSGRWYCVECARKRSREWKREQRRKRLEGVE